jgi:N-acyl-D-aspartate/D-glutamate deacylase
LTAQPLPSPPLVHYRGAVFSATFCRVQRAEGYRWILVIGAVTFEDGRPTGATPGRLLRHGRLAAG